MANEKPKKWDIEHNPRDEWFVIENAHPAIIDRETFDRVQALLKQNRKHTSPSRAKGEHPLDMLVLAPLARLLRRPVIFNPLITLTDTLVEDRRLVAPASVPARLIALLDRAALLGIEVFKETGHV